MPWFLRSLAGLTMGALSFGFLVFIVNPLQMLSIVLLPISKPAFRAFNRACASAVWGWWVWMAYTQNRIDVRITGDPLPKGENALLISNHQTIADVMVLMCLGSKVGRLPDMKWFVKDMMQYVPGPGWGMRFLDCIFVARNWARDQANIERLFSRYARNHIPVLVVSFLEGTRRTPAKLAKSQEYARTQSLPVPQHTLVPRTKGFAATVQGLRDHLDAVYDVTIAYPGRVPSLVDCFACRVERVEIRFRRYTIDRLPVTPEGLADWAHARFTEKDVALATFQDDQRF